MAGGIKGITIEIGGDTSKLGKALNDTEKKSRSLQTELNQVQRLLKFDPTNVELLSQKQEILTQNVAETSQKLDLLKEAEKQVTEQFKRGEASEEQVRALQREIIKTEGVLGSMKNELSSTEKALKDVADGTDNAKKHTKEYAEALNDAEKELDDFKSKASDAFDTVKKGAIGVGGAIVATAGYALKLSTDFDKASNTLITRTGATAEEIDVLNASMETVYTNNFGESIEDVAESMATVRINTKLTGEELERTTEYAILMRDTFGFEVNESTRTAKMLMDQYGISARDAYNLIAQGAQNGLDKNGDLLDTINEYSVHFESLGIDANGMFNMLVNGAENGTFSVDKLGDAVKEFGIRVKDGSTGTSDAFQALGLDVDATSLKFAEGGESANEALNEVITALFNMDDPLAQNTAGVALFGTMWEDLGADAVASLFNVEGKISTTKTALEDINATKYDDIGTALRGLGRTVETDVIQPLGEELKPVVEDAIEYVKANGPEITDILSNVVSKIGKFVGFIVNNGSTIISVLTGIGVGLAVFKVANIINGVVTAIKAFKLANEGATIAQWAMNAAMNANPIGIIIALIAGLIAGFIALWNNCEGFRNFWINLWDIIKNAFSVAWNWIVNTISGFGSWIHNTIIVPVSGFFTGLWDGIKTGASNAWNGIKSVFSTVATFFKNIFTNAWTAVKNVFSTGGKIFSGIKDGIITAFKAVVNTIIKGLNTIVSVPFNGLNGILNTINGIEILDIKPFKWLTWRAPIPQIPLLAKGGIVRKATNAIIGEDGEEAIIPLERNTEWIDNVAKRLNRGESFNHAELYTKLDRIYDRLNRLQVVLNNGALVGEILDDIDAGLSDKLSLNARGV